MTELKIEEILNLREINTLFEMQTFLENKISNAKARLEEIQNKIKEKEKIA